MVPEKTYARYFYGGVAWVVALVVLLSWSAVGAVSGHSARGRVSEQRSAATKVEHFYLVVAGQRSGSEPGPANKLARDLRDLHVPAGSSYAREVQSFRGDSNRYGGVTRELGFDPFEGPNCSECGPLDFDVQDTVIVIKGGGIDAVIAEIESGLVEEDPISGPPEILWLLWFLSFPGYVGTSYVLTKRGEADRYREVTGERQLLGQIHETLRDLPRGDPRAIELSSVAQRLETQINQRVAYRKTKKEDMKLEALATEATSVLEAIEAGNRELT
jgi:hypothetical protein